jgi:hypothetical protein
MMLERCDDLEKACCGMCGRHLASACAISPAGADHAIPFSNRYAAYYDGHYRDIGDGY